MDVPVLQIFIVIMAELAALVRALAALKVHGELLALARDVAFQVLERSEVGKFVNEWFYPHDGISPLRYTLRT